MPSAMNGNRTVHSASPDVESTVGSGSLGGQSPGTQTEVMKQVIGVLEKKVRNMEKKKGKLDDYQAKKNKGESLNQDQLEALSKFPEVTHNLDFARELQKSYLALGQDIQKAVKKASRREQLQREEAEQKRLKTVLELQFLLERLGEDAVRQDLRDGGAALLTITELAALDEFFKLAGPERDQNVRLVDQYEGASLHLFELLEAKDKAVAGTTYKTLKGTLDRVLLSGYFDRTQSRQNGVCEQQEQGEVELPVAAAVVSLDSQEHQCGIEAEVVEEYSEPIQVEASEFVNRQFIPDFTYSSNESEQVDDWTTETEVVGAMQSQPVLAAPSPAALEPQPLHSATPSSPANPVVRKQVVQDLMAQMQGPYNFMQDSMLEFDGQHIDPAIVLAQPMKRAHNVDLPKMEDPPVHPQSCLSQPTTVPVQPESTHVPTVTPTPSMYQSSHTPDPRPPADSHPIQTSLSSSSAQPPPANALLPAQGIQAASKHSGGINVNAAPFQSMQTVFTAPVLPANEPEIQASQFQDSYSQAFSSQTEDPGEQPEMQSEPLQSVEAFQSQEQSLSSSGGHQQPPAQVPGFGRQAQSFYNSRGMARGGPRNARGMINGYRGSANAFRGGYDGYRPPFANTSNSGYGQPQFSTSRDYSNGNYQRDGYQQSYKRGAVQGPRGVSRGNAQAMRS